MKFSQIEKFLKIIKLKSFNFANLLVNKLNLPKLDKN